MGVRAYVVFEGQDELEHFGTSGRAAYEGKWFFQPELLEFFMSQPDLNLLQFFGENQGDQWFDSTEGVALFSQVLEHLSKPENRSLLENYDEEEYGYILQTLASMREIVLYAQSKNKRFHLAATA